MKNIIGFFVNSIKSGIAQDKHLKSINIHLTLPYNGDRDINKIRLDNSFCSHIGQMYPEVPFIFIQTYVDNLGEEFNKIIVNDSFYTLPTWIQDSFISHEFGHNHYGIVKDVIPFSDQYFQLELECDLYAHEQGHNQLQALIDYMYMYPLTFNRNRLVNLAEALGKSKKDLPLIFRY